MHTIDRLRAGRTAPDLACRLRWVLLPMLLTPAFAAQQFLLFDSWSGLPVTFASQTPIFVSLAAVWPARHRPNPRTVLLILAAHLVVIVAVGLPLGRGPFETLPIGIGASAYALALAAWYRRRYDTWCPTDARHALGFFGYGFATAPVGLLFGGFHECPPETLLSDPRLAFVAVIRAGVATSVAIASAMVWYFAPPAASQLGAKPLIPLIVAGSVLGPRIIAQAPSSPVAWMVALGPLCASMMLTPRSVASLVFLMSAIGPFHDYPWYAPGALSWFPPKLFIDLLMGFTPMAATVVASARDRNARMAAQTASQVRAAQEQGGLMSTVFQSMSDGLVLSDRQGEVALSNEAAHRLSWAPACRRCSPDPPQPSTLSPGPARPTRTRRRPASGPRTATRPPCPPSRSIRTARWTPRRSVPCSPRHTGRNWGCRWRPPMVRYDGSRCCAARSISRRPI